MTKAWKQQAIAAVAVLVLMFAAVGAQTCANAARYARLTAQAETGTPKPAPARSQWATIAQSCMAHEGPGLRYRMAGRITAGHGVEVIREKDGWYKCLVWSSEDPLWIGGEYVVLND